MVRLIQLTVTIEAPLAFTDAEAEAFIEAIEDALTFAVDAAAKGVLDAHRSLRTPLADAVTLTVAS